MSGANYWAGRERFQALGTLTVSGSTPIVAQFPTQIDLKRLILRTTTAQTVANDTVTVAVRDLDNGNSETIGTFVVPFSGSVLDKVVYVDLAKPSTSVLAGQVNDQYNHAAQVYQSGTGIHRVRILFNQELVITPGAGATAGAYSVEAQYQDLGFFNVKEATELTFVSAVE